MKYYKVFKDYTNYVSIDETELEKALYAFQTGKPVVFEDGAISRVADVTQDFNKNLGWNSDYKPTPDDFKDIENEKKRCKGNIGEAKEKVNILIRMGRTDLIGKNVDLDQLEGPESNLQLK